MFLVILTTARYRSFEWFSAGQVKFYRVLLAAVNGGKNLSLFQSKHLLVCDNISYNGRVVVVTAQRHAVLAAAKIAGLNCLSLLNETTAVALAYGNY